MVVAGAGVVGAAIAYECAARGARVALLDRDEPGCQASGAAAGMLAPCSEAHQAGAFLDLARQSLAMWPEFVQRVQADGGGDPELVLDGLLRVAVDAEATGDVQGRLRWQQRAGIGEGRWVDTAQARELEPALSPDIAGAAWYPGEGHVHSPRAVAALVQAARNRGAEVRSGAAVAGPSTGRDGIRLNTGEEIAAEHVVLAAGSWLGALGAAFGVALPVHPVHGQLVALRGLPQLPRRVLFAGLHGYVVAKRDGTLLAGATEAQRDFDTNPRDEVTAALRARAERLLPAAREAAEVRAWAGLRPATPDRLPLLGPLPLASNASQGSTTVHVAGGHFRNGVLLAPATAQGMAQMILDGTTPPGWQAFDPARFGDATLHSASCD